MCHDADSSPPVAATPAHDVAAHEHVLVSADATRFAAYTAAPRSTRTRPQVGVVVLPDVRGLAPFYRRLADRLAGHGYPATAIDWYGRTASPEPAARPAGFPGPEHLAGLSRDGQQADARAAAEHLRDPAGGAVTDVVALGFCMGGRAAFLLSAPAFGFAAVIGFYGAPGRVGPYGPGPTEYAAELGAPILALFGGADGGIPPRAVAAFDAALTAAAVPHQIITYPGAPHGFFDIAHTDHQPVVHDAWRRVLRFLADPRTAVA